MKRSLLFTICALCLGILNMAICVRLHAQEQFANTDFMSYYNKRRGHNVCKHTKFKHTHTHTTYYNSAGVKRANAFCVVLCKDDSHKEMSEVELKSHPRAYRQQIIHNMYCVCYMCRNACEDATVWCRPNAGFFWIHTKSCAYNFSVAFGRE